MIKVTYDRQADAAYLQLVDEIGAGGVARTSAWRAARRPGLAETEPGRRVGRGLLGWGRPVPRVSFSLPIVCVAERVELGSWE